MRIKAFLEESPLFALTRASRKIDALSASPAHGLNGLNGPDRLSFLEGLILAATFFEEPRAVKPSQLAETFSTTRGNVSHCLSSLEAKGLIVRKIDPADARAYRVVLKGPGRRSALRVMRSYDRLQRQFEEEIGVERLRETLKTIREIELIFTANATH